ncbi:MAG: class II aldolase/adducin family protein [Deferribacteres bacterium]|nr:class II aldolase/adducin family protein [Deferribacteres bacterium]
MLSKKATRESFVELCRLLYNRNLTCGVGGNVSVRYGDIIMTTPSGLSLRDMTISDIVLVKPDGEVAGGKGRPTREFLMHSRIFEARNDVSVVCHVHGVYLIAASTKMTAGDNSLPPLTPGFCFFAYPLAMLPFHVPGSPELADAVAQHFTGSNTMALLLQNHGLITVGADMRQALNIAEEINEAAQVFILSAGKCSTIPDKDIDRIYRDAGNAGLFQP